MRDEWMVGKRARIVLVLCSGTEYGPRTKLRWLVNDFKLGTFRTRGDAVRAARRAGQIA